MTTDREALVKRLTQWEDGIALAEKNNFPLDSTALLRLITDCKAALSAQQPEPPQNPCTCVPDGDDGTVAHLCKWHRDHFAAQGGEQTDTVSVPREPTEEMIEAAYSIDISGDLAVTYRDVYQAMLFAAPRNCVTEISFARQRIREFDNCIQRVAVALDAVCGGVDGDQADIHSTTSVLLKRIAELKTALTAQGGEQTAEPQHVRDKDWVLAMGHALGLDSGFNVPIVPKVEPFRKLFAEIRERQTADTVSVSLERLEMWRLYLSQGDTGMPRAEIEKLLAKAREGK